MHYEHYRRLAGGLEPPIFSSFHKVRKYEVYKTRGLLCLLSIHPSIQQTYYRPCRTWGPSLELRYEVPALKALTVLLGEDREQRDKQPEEHNWTVE